MVKVTGKCVANAVPTQSEAPTGFCTSSGRWNHLIGECACKPGYTTDSLKGEDKCVGGCYRSVFFLSTSCFFLICCYGVQYLRMHYASLVIQFPLRKLPMCDPL
ncbi:hypothetical protein ANCCAN_30669 [Ancylostoma caninum]|uniref:Uncharacterized protein n=1 Tax=Ancylostoma caninum TaxID=29170 RepID=A0A368EVJ6_ANCCA|nr:hypothetical protein ANCCAN_30669 [Ancylostoma caninum]